MRIFRQTRSHSTVFCAQGLMLAGSFLLASFLGCGGNDTTAPEPIAVRYVVTASDLSPAAGSTVTITAQLVDETSTPVSVAGRVVTWLDAEARGAFSSPNSVTDAGGKASVTYYTSVQANVGHRVRATDNRGTSGISGQIRTVAGPPARYRVTLAGPVVLTSTKVAVYAELLDASGNNVRLAGRVVTWSSTGTGGAFSQATSSTNSSGGATVTFTPGATGGVTHVVTATDASGISGSAAGILTVPGAQGLSVTTMVVGDAHVCVLDPDGAAFCWGWNESGQLGNGFTNNFPAPLAVSGGLRFVALAAGNSHTCGLVAGGAAYCWGNNSSGQLGDNSVQKRLTPVAVAGGLSFVALTAGDAHTCGILAGGAAYCWGSNSFGQLGIGPSSTGLSPQPVQRSLSFVALTAGANHTCGLAADGVAYCWGYNQYGQVGDGSLTSNLTPGLVARSLTFSSLTAGNSHTCGVAAGGAAYCWGRNDLGQLGNVLTINPPIPERIAGDLAFTSVSAGYAHTCGLTPAGVAYCWGSNFSGELGNGTTGSGSAAGSVTPIPVLGNLTFVSIAAGGNRFDDYYYYSSYVQAHTCGLAVNRAVYCWGSNAFGQLGNPETPNGYSYSPFPLKVAGQQ